MDDIIYQDWLVQNSQRKYPVDDGATAVDDSGKELPDSVIIDANIWIPGLFGAVRARSVYISSITSTPSLFSITFQMSNNPAINVIGGTPTIS